MREQKDTTEKEKPDKPLNWRAFIVWPFVIVLLYFLSFGPVWRVFGRADHLYAYAPVCRYIYLPWDWVYENTPLHKPLGKYMHLWVPYLYDDNGESYFP